MVVANTLVYCVTETIAAVKCFKVQAPGRKKCSYQSKLECLTL